MRTLPQVSAGLIDALRTIVGDAGVVARPAGLRVYECDAYTIEKATPQLVVLPASTEEVSAVCRTLFDAGIAFVPRGAGTGLSGGCLPLAASVVIGTSRMRRILAIDPEERRAVVEAGVVNLDISKAAAPFGLAYAPDPSSQMACTIGGNIAENSGGPHTLKYGVTTNHVLGVELVLADGEVVTLGGSIEDGFGYDLTGVAVGAEGTFGIVTRATVRLVPVPPACETILAVFDDVDAASATVSSIIRAGIVPAALEMMDQLIVGAVEEAYGFGFPTDAGAVLIVEVDGLPAAVAEQVERIRRLSLDGGAVRVDVARDAVERALLWKSRKRAFGAVGRLAPNYCTQDGVVPRSQVPEILRRIREIGQRHDLRIGNVFHAGDGNIHPIILFDERDSDQVQRVLRAGDEILSACVALGGSITGEHGIGVEKIPQIGLLFSDDDLETMQRIRTVFDPHLRANPGKIFPTPRGCIENVRPRRQVPA